MRVASVLLTVATRVNTFAAYTVLQGKVVVTFRMISSGCSRRGIGLSSIRTSRGPWYTNAFKACTSFYS